MRMAVVRVLVGRGNRQVLEGVPTNGVFFLFDNRKLRGEVIFQDS